MASEKIINQKKEEVAKLAAEIKEANLVLLVDYRGINVEDVTNLRTSVRNTNASYRVIKNKIDYEEVIFCYRCAIRILCGSGSTSNQFIF